MSSRSHAANRVASTCRTEKLSELHSLAHESAGFYSDAVRAAGKGSALGLLFARLAHAKTGLAASMARASLPSGESMAACAAGASATVRRLRDELKASGSANGEIYAAKMQAVEQGQLKAVLEFLDRDIPMSAREPARLFLCAIHRHQDLIDHAMARNPPLSFAEPVSLA